MERNIQVLYSFRQAIENNHLKHVQVLQGVWNGRMVIKLLSVDTESLKDKIKAIAEKESLELARETKTTLFYFI